ncbi:MAG: DUF72 domain-containing protein [Chloroflexi bacterium]|nr:DUF72 domain-containing protein [Chloroflexota bacterium]
MIYVGTSGFSYDDWVGAYYPPNLSKNDWLTFYAKEFNALEINYTYYRMPTAKTLAGMARKVPDGFLFTLKTPQEMTHTRDADASLFLQFIEALKPLAEQKKFGTVLAQFPSSFHNTRENADYLKHFREHLRDLPIVVEFRNAQWLNDKTFAFLREHKTGFCCVDEPRLKGLLPPIAEATSQVAYVRFHGRNAAKWWDHAQAYERYDYTYSKAELEEWTPKIQKLNQLSETVFVFANNHYRAQGIDTARQLRLLLE